MVGMGSPFDGCCRRYHGTMDCDSVVVCAARWSLMASGDGMAYASGICYGSLPGGHCRQYNYIATEHSHQTFHASLHCFVFSFFCVCVSVLNMPCRCNDD